MSLRPAWVLAKKMRKNDVFLYKLINFARNITNKPNKYYAKNPILIRHAVDILVDNDGTDYKFRHERKGDHAGY